MRILSLLLICLCLTFSSGCAKAPPNLPPDTLVVWKANEAVVAIGTVQHVAIELNKILICDPPPNQTNCHSVLSDKNTGIVVDAVRKVLLTIQQVPSGWRQTVLTGLDQIDAALDELGKAKLKAYTAAARVTVSAL